MTKKTVMELSLTGLRGIFAQGNKVTFLYTDGMQVVAIFKTEAEAKKFIDSDWWTLKGEKGTAINRVVEQCFTELPMAAFHPHPGPLPERERGYMGNLIQEE